MHKQQALRDASRIIEDSLFALSKRAPQVSSKINREINAIDKKTASAIDHLRERLSTLNDLGSIRSRNMQQSDIQSTSNTVITIIICTSSHELTVRVSWISRR